MNFIKKFLNKKKSNTKVFDISLEKIQGSFEKMQHEAGWDISKKMFWGYYFLDHDLKKLEKFTEALIKDGFEIVEMRQVEGDNLFLLHAEENVVHSAKSLFNQCHQFAELAQKNNIEIFDGWDVEPVQMNKGLVE